MLVVDREPRDSEKPRLALVPAADEAGVCVQRSEHRVDHLGRELVLEIPLGARVAVSAQLVDRGPVGDDRVVAVGDHVCVARERSIELVERGPP